MKIVLVKGAEKSLTAQIYDQIRAYALNRDDKTEEKLPSIRALAVELAVSVITVKNAYEMLECDGFVFTKAGSGVFFVNLEQSAVEKIKLDQAQTTIKAVEKAIQDCKESGINRQELINLIEKIYRG